MYFLIRDNIFLLIWLGHLTHQVGVEGSNLDSRKYKKVHNDLTFSLFIQVLE